MVLMTFSEFGRRVKDNGSNGTDHGTAAPVFVIGTKVKGGIFGNVPSLTTLDNNGDLLVQFDYRQLYASAMMEWFGADGAEVDGLLGGIDSTHHFSTKTLPLFAAPPPSYVDDQPEIAGDYALYQNYPNPFNPTTTIRYRGNGVPMMLRVYDGGGRLVQSFPLPTGDYGEREVTFDASNLPSGAYRYELVTPGRSISKEMMLVR